MIQHEKGLFLLKNKHFSYLLRINRYGLPEHLHFGAPLELTDAEAMLCRPGIGWGESVLLDDRDSASCPDVLPLEWSGAGRGDYRETPLELNDAATEMRYVNHEIRKDILPMVSGLPQAKQGGETLILHLQQHNARVQLVYTLFDQAITRRVWLSLLRKGWQGSVISPARWNFSLTYSIIS